MASAKPSPVEESLRAWGELAVKWTETAWRLPLWWGRDDGYTVLDPLVIAAAFQRAGEALLADPARLAAAQHDYVQQAAELWAQWGERLFGAGEAAPGERTGDRRFKDPLWREHPLFALLLALYRLNGGWLLSLAGRLDGLEEHERRKVAFYTRQMVDALAPSNAPATNPEVLAATAESGGANLARGLTHMLEDMERGEGRLRPKMTDLDAFRVGESIATTPGKVVYQNELMQLLQYAPSTAEVHERPLLIVPPWINKFYILDLRPANSFIRWAVDQGHTVFLVSWVDPDERYAETRFDDYLLRGPVAALGVIGHATGAEQINAIGYCIGGTLLACALSWLAARGDDRVASATFFTSLLDFSEVGDISVFLDEEQLGLLDRHMARRGYLEGIHMADAFSLLRANELIWSYVVNNYLLGREPPAFDILYWNADSTRMPAAMHGWYLRNMYQRNRLRVPGALSLAGVPIDLGRIRLPAYFLSTREDHIAPWRTTYRGAALLPGPTRFVLAASGHVAGVVNPPAARKYGHWTGGPPAADVDPEAWLEKAAWHEGSWWPDWGAWLEPHAGGLVPARIPGAGALPALEDAPGSYVLGR